MKELRILLLGILVVMISIYTHPSIKARSASQQQVGVIASQTALAVQPTIVEVVLSKDGVTKREIEIYNLTNQAIPIKAMKQSFTSQNKEDISKENLEQYDSSSWITLLDSDTDFILQPQEVKKVTLVIQQPKNASPGGHYATIYFQPLIPSELISKDSAYVYVRVAVLILMQNPGEIIENMEIGTLNLNGFYENFPIEGRLSLKNTGNIHLLPIGQIIIKNDLTNEVVQIIDIKNELSLPGLDKHYQFKIDSPYLFGKFTAETVINYGIEKKVLTSDKVTFYIAPYKQIIVFLVLMIFIALFRERISRAVRILFERRTKDSSHRLGNTVNKIKIKSKKVQSVKSVVIKVQSTKGVILPKTSKDERIRKPRK